MQWKNDGEMEEQIDVENLFSWSSRQEEFTSRRHDFWSHQTTITEKTEVNCIRAWERIDRSISTANDFCENKTSNIQECCVRCSSVPKILNSTAYETMQELKNGIYPYMHHIELLKWTRKHTTHMQLSKLVNVIKTKLVIKTRFWKEKSPKQCSWGLKHISLSKHDQVVSDTLRGDQ